jgi:hypothetical protein
VQEKALSLMHVKSARDVAGACLAKVEQGPYLSHLPLDRWTGAGRIATGCNQQELVAGWRTLQYS